MGDRIDMLFKNEFMKIAVEKFMSTEQATEFWKMLKENAKKENDLIDHYNKLQRMVDK